MPAGLSADLAWFAGVAVALLGSFVAAVWYVVSAGVKGGVNAMSARLDAHIAMSAGDTQALKARVDAGDTRLRECDQRLVSVEHDVRALAGRADRIADRLNNLPSVKDMHAVVVSIAEMKGAIIEIETRLAGRVDQTEAVVSRVEAVVGRWERYMVERG